MNSVLLPSAIRFGGAAPVVAAPPVAPPGLHAAGPVGGGPGPLRPTDPGGLPLLIPKPLPIFVPFPRPPLLLSLPMAASQAGNLFADRNDPNLHWYLPAVALADDPDPGFAFDASQAGQDAEGRPFYSAQLTLDITRSMPPDAVALHGTNPGASLREIPLAGLAATLSTFYADDGGVVRQRDIGGTMHDQGAGRLLLTFGPILGSSVLCLYQDLTVFGKARVTLGASFQAWAGTDPASMVRPQFANLALAQAGPTQPAIRPLMSSTTIMRPMVPIDPPPARPLSVLPQPWGTQLPLDLKYNQGGYQLKFTVSTAQIPRRVIRDASDLRDFASGGSEFRELKALGDISLRYPSLSRAYVGSFSRTIVVIPARYSIVRGRSGCAAVCMALADGSAASGSKCKFEFDFTVGPQVSRIEFLQFAQEIQGNPDLKDYKLRFPDFLQDNPLSSLETAFASDARFAAGPDPHTFVLSVSTQDQGTQTPAVANANLFIMQLCSNVGAGLVGSLSLKLDDAYAAPVLAPVVLNFASTTGSDEFDVQLDATGGQIVVTNESPLDLQVSRYALATPAVIQVCAGPVVVAAAAGWSLPLPADHAGLSLATDAQLVLPAPLTKVATAKFLNFRQVDVQETQYVVAVDGSGVDFGKTKSVTATITFPGMPDLVPRVLTITANLRADSLHIVIPLENAVFTLPGEVQLAVTFTDPARPPLAFTVENDFTARPVLLLSQDDIDARAK